MTRKKSKLRTRLTKQRKSFSKFLAVFEKQVELAATEANKEIAKQFTDEAKEVIENQLYNWEPLKDEYLDSKIKKGYDPRTLIRTREYLESISWGVTQGRVWAGIPAQKIHQGSGLPVRVLARIHEFGTATIPPRPLWRPLLSKYIQQKPEFGRRYRKAVARAVKKAT